MKKITKISLGCLGVVCLVIVVLSAIGILIYTKKNKYDKIVIPFFEEVMPVLTKWDPQLFQSYWAPEVVESLNQADTDKLFGMFRRLGSLKSYEEPEFLQVGANTNIPYKSYVHYAFQGVFEHGDAMLSWTLVPNEQGELLVWYFKIDSDVFIVPVEEP